MLLKVAGLAALAAASTVDERDTACTPDMAPMQIRLAYHLDREFAVSWNTKQQMKRPTVFFSEDDKLDRSAWTSISTTYPSSSTYNNHVVIRGLTPGTTYNYRPQCGTVTYKFTTARLAGDGTPFSFAMVGDLGTMGPDGLSTKVGTGAANPLSPGDKTTIDSLISMKPNFDFVWHGV
jgi:hypothetical protein